MSLVSLHWTFWTYEDSHKEKAEANLHQRRRKAGKEIPRCDNLIESAPIVKNQPCKMLLIFHGPCALRYHDNGNCLNTFVYNIHALSGRGPSTFSHPVRIAVIDSPPCA